MNLEMLDTESTIVACATPSGGGVMVIRLSGSRAIEIADAIFQSRKPLRDAEGYTLHYGEIVDESGEFLDDVVVALFRAPRSYTGDDTVEFTIHGSQYIASRLIHHALSRGARMATAGEFTRRAFLAGKLDLSRAEAVADIIVSDSKWSHRIAATQMRGNYARLLSELRDELLRLCSLLELELDFGEEDVEFANRTTLKKTMEHIGQQLEKLTSSFALGNALKEGVSVAIIGEPNVGKSTLLNRLVEEDRALVSDIAGTTRDTIEAMRIIDGIRYRFIDTAGLRSTSDRLEQMGIERTRRAVSEARIVVHVASADCPMFESVELGAEQHYIRVINKADTLCGTDYIGDSESLYISAKDGIGLDKLLDELRSAISTNALGDDGVVVSNARHYTALNEALTALRAAQRGLEQDIPTDLLSEDIRQVLHHLGEITGEITSDDILHSIFSKFCIGK